MNRRGGVGKETFLGLDYAFDEDGESSRIQAYFAERAPNAIKSHP